MKKLLILAAVLASMVMTTGCSTLSKIPPANQVSNGEYHVYVYPGNLPHVEPSEDNAPAEFGVKEFDQLVYLDRDCRTQMFRQVPSTFKSVGTSTARTAVPVAIGAGIGTAWGIADVTSATGGYGLYGAKSGGGSGAGAGLAGGIDRKNTGDRYSQAGCVNAGVTEAKKKVGALEGTYVIFNADTVNGRSITRPAGEAPTELSKARPDPNAVAAEAPPKP